MYIVAVAWIYVVLMMSLTEHSLVAGIMTFLLYGVLPLSIILYLLATPERKRHKAATNKMHDVNLAEKQESMPASEHSSAASNSE